MKTIAKEFLRRGLSAFGFGPIVLAVIYLILHESGIIESLSVCEVSTGIISVSILVFLAGVMNAIYQIEKLPLFWAISIHGAVLYVGYLLTYLINHWLEFGATHILVFTGIFVFGYLLIWAIIYAVIRNNTAKVNEMLKERQKNTDAT